MTIEDDIAKKKFQGLPHSLDRTNPGGILQLNNDDKWYKCEDCGLEWKSRQTFRKCPLCGKGDIK